jgi:hypothetical protein
MAASAGSFTCRSAEKRSVPLNPQKNKKPTGYYPVGRNAIF